MSVPTVANLRWLPSDGRVLLDANHGHTGLCGEIGWVRPFDREPGWTWTPASDPDQTYGATTRAEAEQQLLAHVLAAEGIPA